MKSWFLNHARILRRSMQVFTLLFLIAIPILNRNGIDALVGTLYSIDLFGWTILDPAMFLQLLMLGEGVTLAIVLGILVPVLLALIAGRVFCSWMCPYNFIAEGLYGLRRRFSRNPRTKGSNPSPRGIWISLAVVFGTIAITGLPLMVFLSMPGLISAELSDIIFGGGLGLELALVGGLLVVDTLFLKRMWCRTLCPVGAILALLRTPFTLKIQSHPRQCVQCDGVKDQLCVKSCPLDLNPRRSHNLYPTCYNCLDCVDTCQHHGGALELTQRPSAKRPKRRTPDGD